MIKNQKMEVHVARIGDSRNLHRILIRIEGKRSRRRPRLKWEGNFEKKLGGFIPQANYASYYPEDGGSIILLSFGTYSPKLQVSIKSLYHSTNLYGTTSQKVHDLLPLFPSIRVHQFSPKGCTHLPKKHGVTSQKQHDLRPLLHSVKMEASGLSVTWAHVYHSVPTRLQSSIHRRDVTHIF
jgi:hypothetical protein